MDATEYSKIADRIMQWKGRLPKELHQNDNLCKQYIAQIQTKLSETLVLLDTLAKMDDMGWVK